MPLDPVGQASEENWIIPQIISRNQPQMPLRQLDLRCPRQAAENRRQAGHRSDRLPQQLFMARTADPVEEDAGEVQARIEAAEPLNEGGGTARLGAGIDHQDDATIKPTGDLGAAAGVRVAGGAVEQPHYPFNYCQVGAGAPFARRSPAPATRRTSSHRDCVRGDRRRPHGARDR